MRQSRPRSIRPLAAASVAVVLLVVLASPVGAKEGLQGRLDAPIAMGTPQGTLISVGVTVVVPTEDGTHPVEGSPIYLKLFGRDGSSTRAAGAADGTPGHYTMEIEIPAGGARRIEIGLHGTTDLPMRLMEDPFTFGPITPGTAQAVPAAAVATARPATPVTPPAVAPGATSLDPAQMAAAALGSGGVLALLLALVAGRRRRAGTGEATGAGSTVSRSA